LSPKELWQRQNNIRLSCQRCGTLLLLLAAAAIPIGAQDNYEIQVYGSDTVAPKNTMLELHSNFTIDGSEPVPGSQYPPRPRDWADYMFGKNSWLSATRTDGRRATSD
jgi:hypothetical protein